MSKAKLPANKLLPIPDKLVVLTFDDRSITWFTFVAPLLKSYGFGATFFVSEAPWLYDGHEELWISWEKIIKLCEDGFEIGNHSATHPDFCGLSKEEMAVELKPIEQLCKEHGMPRPVTFCYPSYGHNQDVIDLLMDRGYLFARRGVAPEMKYSDRGDRGPAYDSTEDHPLLIPTTWSSGPNWTSVEDIAWVVDHARDGKISILTFHGVPDYYPHCTTNPVLFEKYMKYLNDQGCTVIALGDLVKYVDPFNRPDDPYEPIRKRIARMEAAADVQE